MIEVSEYPRQGLTITKYSEEVVISNPETGSTRSSRRATQPSTLPQIRADSINNPAQSFAV